MDKLIEYYLRYRVKPYSINEAQFKLIINLNLIIFFFLVRSQQKNSPFLFVCLLVDRATLSIYSAINVVLGNKQGLIGKYHKVAMPTSKYMESKDICINEFPNE